MPKMLRDRPLTVGERQQRYWSRLKRENYRAVDDETLLAECQRRGLIPADQLPDTGTAQEAHR